MRKIPKIHAEKSIIFILWWSPLEGFHPAYNPAHVWYWIHHFPTFFTVLSLELRGGEYYTRSRITFLASVTFSGRGVSVVKTTMKFYPRIIDFFTFSMYTMRCLIVHGIFRLCHTLKLNVVPCQITKYSRNWDLKSINWKFLTLIDRKLFTFLHYKKLKKFY